MTLIVVLSAIIAASLVYLGYIFFRRFSDLKNLDPDSILEQRQSEAKTKIIQAKLARQGAKIKNNWKKLTAPKDGALAGKFKKFKDKVSALEEKYHDDLSDDKTKPATVKDILKEAKKLVGDGEFDQAEKMLIEVISQDKDSVDAYETLGDLYFKNKKYDQAEETIRYLIKLSAVQSGSSPDKLGISSLKRGVNVDEEIEFLGSLDISSKIATYYDDLAQVYEAVGKDDKVLDSFLKASSIEPNNPKYLDKLIELGIKLGDRGLAKKIFNRLKKINPENAKLVEMKSAIEKM